MSRRNRRLSEKLARQAKPAVEQAVGFARPIHVNIGVDNSKLAAAVRDAVHANTAAMLRIQRQMEETAAAEAVRLTQFEALGTLHFVYDDRLRVEGVPIVGVPACYLVDPATRTW